MSLFVSDYKTVFSFACCSILRKMLKKLLRNLELKKTKKLPVLEPVLFAISDPGGRGARGPLMGQEITETTPIFPRKVQIMFGLV